MAKNSKSNKKLAELKALETSVEHVRDLMAGKKAIGLDFSLGASLGNFATLFASAATRKGQVGLRDLTRLGEPSEEACLALAAGFKEMHGAVFRREQAKVDEITALFEQLNVSKMLENYLVATSVEVEAHTQAAASWAEANVEKSIHMPRARQDMNDVPIDRYRTGFGLSEVDEWSLRLAAVGETVAIVDGSSLPPKESATDLEKVARIFATVSAAVKPDWYSLSRFLGHPSLVHCRDMANALFSLATAVKIGHGEAFNEYRSTCTKGYVGEMLDNYLSLASGGEYLPENGAVYIAWSSSDRNTLQIGVAYDQIEDELRSLDHELRLPHQHGVLAAWLVHDVDEAQDAIAAKLRDRLQPGHGYKIRLRDAKSEIQEVLDATANTVLSPWHGDDETVTADSAKPPILGVV